MEKQFNLYLNAATKIAIDYCTSEKVSSAEAEAIACAFEDELINKIGNYDRLGNPEIIALMASGKTIDDKIEQLRKNREITYSECEDGINLCVRLKTIIHELTSKHVTFPQKTREDCDRLTLIFRNKRDCIQVVDRIIKNVQQVNAIIQSNCDVISCDTAIKLLNEIENDTKKCKQNGVNLPANLYCNTAEYRSILIDIKRKAEEKNKLKKEIDNTDAQISTAIKEQLISPDKCEKIIHLCGVQKKKLDRVNKLDSITTFSIKNANLDEIEARFKQYLQMLSLDSEIIAFQNNFSLDLADLLKKKCKQQEILINRCRQNGWPIPTIQALNPNKTATDILRLAQRSAKMKEVKKKALRVALISALAFLVILFGLYKYREGKKQSPFDSDYAIGRNKDEIVSELYKAGFENIIETEDFSGWGKSDTVTRVLFGDSESFAKGAYRKQDESIIVYYSSKDRIDLTQAMDKWNDRRVDELVKLFRQWKFTNVTTTKIATHDKNKNFLASKIYLNGVPFTEGSCFIPQTARIVVEYYALKLQIGQTAEQFEDKQYAEVVATLTEKGYLNIKLKRANDLITGWINSEGSIKTISINGNSSFSETDEFFFDDEIVIVVHTFSKGCEDITEIDEG